MKTILGSFLALGLMATAASAQCYGGHHARVAKVEKPVEVTPAPAPAPVEPAPAQPAPVPQK